MHLLVIFVMTAVAAVASASSARKARELSDENVCSANWKLMYENNANGGAVQGSKGALMNAVTKGARVRVVINTWGPNGYSAETDNLSIVGQSNLCAQVLWHVSKKSYDRFQDNAYWWFVMLCTDGFTQMSRYNVGSHTSRGDTKTTTGIKWFVKHFSKIGQPVLSQIGGFSLSGSLSALATAVQNGKDIRAVTRSSGFAFPFQNVGYKQGNDPFVYGQSLWHVSQTSIGQRNEFQRNAYWWFTHLSTRGTRDMSRWTIGEHQSRGHTRDKVGLDWFADECWRHVFTNNGNGETVSGSLANLVSAIKQGHRVRFVLPEVNSYSSEANNIRIRNGQVTIQALGHVSMASDTLGFQDDAYWYWLMISTTGTVKAERYNVGSNVHRGKSTHKRKIKWFVDTRPWTKVLSHYSSGNQISGSLTSLRQAIKNGASIRIGVPLAHHDYYQYPANNLAISSDNNVGAQHIHHISVQNAGNLYEIEMQPNAYWWFTIVTTRGERDMTRYSVGSHTSRGHTQDRVSLDWFANF